MTNKRFSDYIARYCFSVYGINPTEAVFLLEPKDFVKHSCMGTGIAVLSRERVDIPTEEGMVSADFFFCRTCGKLYIYKDPTY